MLGVIADDFTGATDVASMLVRAGRRTVLAIEAVGETPVGEADAVVVALKTRTAPVAQAVADSLAALHALRREGARQIYLKVCSTFDSTAQGNIGPVADALARACGAGIVAVCPALPENGRTVYQGHLFVGGQLLSESGMKDHPLTPMRDAHLVRVLQAQTPRPVGLAAWPTVRQGPAALAARLRDLQAEGCAYAIVDALEAADLQTLAQAVQHAPLVVAGSGLALAWPATVTAAADAPLDAVGEAAAVLAGSCSTATRAQVAAWQASGRPHWRLDVGALLAGRAVVADALAWAAAHHPAPVLIHASTPPQEVQRWQGAAGAADVGDRIETALAAIAGGLVEAGVQRLVVAGGETSGAVVRALGAQRLRVGAAIAPGVPWCQVEGRALHLALKSGNFGGEGFFLQALGV